MRETVVVTGGAGFIGSHVVERLAATGRHVIVVDDLSTGCRGNIADIDGVELLEADVHDVGVERLGSSVRGIVHLAAVASVQQSWEEPFEVQRRNLGSTLQVIEWARALGSVRVVFSSSAAVYGNPERLPVTEGATAHPLSPYGLHKLAGEIYLRLFARDCRFSAVALRLFNVYGPRQSERSDYAGVISRFAGLVESGASVDLHGGGDQTRDFVHVADVASAVLGALDAPIPVGGFACYNVGNQVGVSVRDLLHALERAAGRSVQARVTPARTGDIKHSVADIRLAREQLGFEPRVSLHEGLSDYLAWLRSAAMA